MDPKRLEGVRPKHAVCAHCDYQFGGGVAINAGRLRCPECGRATDIVATLAARTPSRAEDPLRRGLRKLALLALVVVVACLVLLLPVLLK